VKLKITIDQKHYEVDVEVLEGEEPEQAAPMPGSTVVPAAPPPLAPSPTASMNGDKAVRSPIAGVVVKIPTSEGQQIQPNDTLIVLEAMKMETNIASPLAGRIKKIHAAQGEPVQSGQVLVEFE
jgi:methylmalonyl-CoA carboxyltransferase small subunit